MASRRTLASLLICSFLLAGCGDDGDGDRSEAGGTSTTVAAVVDGVPADDGGELCSALTTWSDAHPTTEPTAVAAGQVMSTAADDFTEEVLPSVPAELRDAALEFQASMKAAGDSLAAYSDPDATAEEAYASGLLTPLNSFMLLTSTRVRSSLDEPEGAAPATVYNDLFVAWLADPCGPKPLETDGEADFQPVGDSI